MKERIVDIRNARNAECLKKLEEAERTGICPFCNISKEEVLNENKGWIIKKNDYPYVNTKHHFVIISRDHKVINELTPADLMAIHFLMEWTIKEYQIEGGALVMRFGDTKLTGSTIVHLHAHLITPELDLQTGLAKVVNFPIG